jgi:hypothetical protein
MISRPLSESQRTRDPHTFECAFWKDDESRFIDLTIEIPGNQWNGRNYHELLIIDWNIVQKWISDHDFDAAGSESENNRPAIANAALNSMIMSSNSMRLLKATWKAIHRLDDSELISIDEAKTSRSSMSVQTWYLLTQNFIHFCQPSLFVSFRFPSFSSLFRKAGNHCSVHISVRYLPDYWAPDWLSGLTSSSEAHRCPITSISPLTVIRKVIRQLDHPKKNYRTCGLLNDRKTNLICRTRALLAQLNKINESAMTAVCVRETDQQSKMSELLMIAIICPSLQKKPNSNTRLNISGAGR